MSSSGKQDPEVVAYLRNAALGEQRALYRLLSEFLGEHRHALEDLVSATLDLGEQVEWLLTSSRWKVGRRVAHPFAGNPPEPAVQTLCGDEVAAAESWGSEKSAALAVFVDSLIPAERVEGMGEAEARQLLDRHIPVLVDVTRECIADAEALGEMLEATLTESIRFLESTPWRVGDFVINDVVKRLRGSANRRMAWAPENIRALQESFAPKHAETRERVETLARAVGESGGFDGAITGVTGLEVLATVSLARRGPLRELEARNESVTIVVPVYNAYEVLEDCFDSLLAHTDSRHGILLIDDASPDERVWPLLEKYAAEHESITVVRNEGNLGFPGTVNRGFEMSCGDVIILNSDTEVTARWVEKLVDAAYSREKVASVTPLTNSGSVFSVPEMHVANTLPEHLNLAVAADAHERCSLWLRPEAPTGNGFCMYMRREPLDAVGVFDAETFQRGYGEENDWCVRASQEGFVHLIDDATFILHKENASFEGAANENKTRALALLRERYPDYDARIEEWLKDDALANLRYTLKSIWEGRRAVPLDSYLLADARPTLLFLVHDGAGGTIIHVEDLARALWSEFRCVFLYTGDIEWRLSAYTGKGFETIREFEFEHRWSMTEPLDASRMDAVRSVLDAYSPECVHVHHWMWNGPELAELFRERGAKVVFSAHDFYTVCPSHNLLDQDYVYCGGVCTEGPGECPIDIKGTRIPNLKHGYVFEWRERMGRMLASCDRIVSFSEAGREPLLSAFPELDAARYEVIPHGHRLEHSGGAVSVAPAKGRMRVLLLGSISPSKGLGLFREIVELNRKAGEPLEFFVVGNVHPSFKPEEHGVHAHGAYRVEELPEILREIAPSVGLIPSLWGETFCFTLSECWAAGIPVVASDLGTLRARMLESGGGWLVDPQSPEAWFEQLQRIASDTAEWTRARDKVVDVKLGGLEEMARAYRELYLALVR